MPIKVAVVGSGIAAASTCYFLKKELKENIHIDVYEQHGRLGGRTESIVVDGHNMELGAGIAYGGNKYMVNWTKEFGLVKKKPPKNEFGLWNGERFVFKESSVGTLTALKLLDRYGYDLVTLRSMVSSATASFDDIYKLQDKGVCFETPGELWKSVDLYDLTQQSFREAVEKKMPQSCNLLTELMFAVNKVNYNQNNEINALAGTVSMCPLVTGDVFSLTTGWTSIHKAIFRKVENVFLHTPVTRIASLPQSSKCYSHQMKYSIESNEDEQGLYDAVVVTSPMEINSDGKSSIEITLDGSVVKPTMHCRPYQTTHTTFVKGKMNDSYFSIKEPNSLTNKSILSSALHFIFGDKYENPLKLPQAVYLVDGAEKKVSTLQKLFSSDSCVVATREWKAYPQFSPPENTSTGFRFEIDGYVNKTHKHRVYSTFVLEGCVAAMEVSAISGRNVALLIQQDFAKYLSKNSSD